MIRSTVLSDDGRRARVCKILCDMAGLPGLWTTFDGPTQRARTYLESDRRLLSVGQDTAVLVAWTIWDGQGGRRRPQGVTLNDVLEGLEGQYLLPIATLLVAIAGGDREVDAWIASNDGRHS